LLTPNNHTISSVSHLTVGEYYQDLKGYFTSGKMSVYLKWIIYVEEMSIIFEFGAF